MLNLLAHRLGVSHAVRYSKDSTNETYASPFSLHADFPSIASGQDWSPFSEQSQEEKVVFSLIPGLLSHP